MRCELNPDDRRGRRVVATTDQPAKLSALVPAGHYCRAVTSAASANATPNLVASTKQVL